jgi:S1-C subfamily serine protease
VTASRTRWRATRLVAAVAISLVLVLAGAGSAYLAGRGLRASERSSSSVGSGLTTKSPVAAPQTTAPDTSSADPAAVAAKVDPSVVDIDTVLGYQNAAAAGTGIVLSSDGLVLTNNHVVAGSTSISAVDIGNDRSYRASVVGYDRTDDIAVLRLTAASGLAAATLGDSSTVRTGDDVVAIGNAGGAGGTPTAVAGTVTALDQSIAARDQSTGVSARLNGLIEIAAAVEPGDSGGPLATPSGKIIGMNTAASVGDRSQVAGYAIPINQAFAIAKQIQARQASGTVHIGATAFLGVQSGSRGRNASASGAPVLGVLSGSPAQAVGLSAGDVIVSVNGQGVDSPGTLTSLLDRYHPGDHLTIGWTTAAGQARTATVTATTGPVG